MTPGSMKGIGAILGGRSLVTRCAGGACDGILLFRGGLRRLETQLPSSLKIIFCLFFISQRFVSKTSGRIGALTRRKIYRRRVIGDGALEVI